MEENYEVEETIQKKDLAMVIESDHEEEDDDESENMLKLISLVHERHPLWDHRIPMSTRNESIKRTLWNDIHVELKGLFKRLFNIKE